ncbi:PA2169 family four-helix-bundle protein [Methylophaga pinxianii]|uniref:PA2169 family four-helix-bundle protein n=1 Tax=Methylophaga pinxianii TaxID=2881052 RepID=UPI001CF56CC7|nr:PA2169 family four-helix-bundle protein [Methylophaga pinxianii]MCB2427460.1 PA2169 family four-helix-bundle protein [Methylophaga pinxianii]UPH44741.1 PA2169 family four-helix-bundle protein [Methylophaga pinxianii]
MTDMQSEDIIKKLNNLIEIDYDAIAAYKAAIERLEDKQLKQQLVTFMEDHKNHVTALTESVRLSGGNPADSGDMKKILTKGKVVIAELGGDDAILKAMKMNEEVTNKSYEAMVDEPFPGTIKLILQNGLADERRHRAWLDATIEQISS